MKFILAILFPITLLFALPLPTDTLLTLSGPAAVLLTDGSANYVENDTVSAITAKDGVFWVKADLEKLEFIIPAGIIKVSGSAWISVQHERVHFKVYQGFLRFISAGGTPGETISAGYERVVTRVKAEEPRRLINNDLWETLCTDNPTRGVALGCPEPVQIVIAESEPVEIESDSSLILIHEATSTKELQTFVDAQSLHTVLKSELELWAPRGTEIITAPKDLLKSFNLSRESRPYKIVDLSVSPNPNSPRKFFVTVTVFDGIALTMKKKQFSTRLESTLSFQENKPSSTFSPELYKAVKTFIFP